MSVMVFLVIPVLLVLLGAFAASIAWVWRDAERRGQPGFIVAVLVAFLFWPLSLLAWLAARPAISTGGTATPGRGERGCLWAALALALIVLLPIGLGILLPVFFLRALVARPSAFTQQAVSQAKRAESSATVKQVAVAYLVYQTDHGQAPTALADLGLDPNQFPSHAQFELLPGTNATDIIVREDWKNHGGKGGAIAFGDGHVEWVDSPYKPLRMDVVRAGVEKQLRQQLGDEFVKVGTVNFDARANRYDVAVHWRIDEQEGRSVVDLSQVGARAGWRQGDQKQFREWLTRSAGHTVLPADPQDFSVYAGSLELVRRQGTYRYSILVDELMEGEPRVEKELP